MVSISATPSGGVKKPPVKAKAAFNARNYLKNNKMETGAILAGTAMGVLALGTTALTPYLAIPVAAAALMAGSVYVLARTSDTLVENAGALGHKRGLSGAAIGVILGALTSMPELCASVAGVFQGMPDIGIGNITGSNIANILLILGTTALIKPLASKSPTLKFNTWSMIGATAVMGGLVTAGTFSAAVGAGLLAAFAGYGYYMMKHDKPDEHKQTPTDKEAALRSAPSWFNSALGLASLGGVIGSAALLVSSASAFALGMGIPASIVGPFFVAVGTSMPELAVNIKSALKGQTEVAIGNIVGSNVFNVLMVGGMMAASYGTVSSAGITVPSMFDPTTALGALNMVGLGGSAALLARTLLRGKPISRGTGLAWVGLYAAFAAASYALGGSVDAGAAAAAASTVSAPGLLPPAP